MFEINPLSDALGAEIVGLDLSESLDDEAFARVHQAHLDFQVLVFREQRLTPDQHIAFSRRFGELSGHVYDQFLLPGHPEILKVSNKKKADGDFAGLASAGRRWHSDLSYSKTPSLGSLLYALEIPPTGGDTLFNNM
ncbi:MAG: TauD/TfdA dioxygenase family protein, partial [Alphaproteobacteria bacterium]